MTFLRSSFRRGLVAFMALGLGAFFAPAASAAIVEIQKITCIKASESDGDELRVRISIDSKSPFTLSRTMKTGQVWQLNRKVEIKATVHVRLDEHDPLAPDENLGTNFTTASNGAGAWIYQAHGATYYVHFIITNGQKGFIFRMHSLRAVKAQESNGDDMFMKIYKDKASAQRSGERTLKTGQVWNMMQDVHFFEKAAVTFHENDPLSPDDQLGGLTVLALPTAGVRTRTFNRNGMNYVLTYEVVKK